MDDEEMTKAGSADVGDGNIGLRVQLLLESITMPDLITSVIRIMVEK